MVRVNGYIIAYCCNWLYKSLLSIAIVTRFRKRSKIPQYNTFIWQEINFVNGRVVMFLTLKFVECFASVCSPCCSFRRRKSSATSSAVCVLRGSFGDASYTPQNGFTCGPRSGNRFREEDNELRHCRYDFGLCSTATMNLLRGNVSG